MEYYPQILLPENLLRILSQKEYNKPREPKEPSKPNEQSNPIMTKILFLFFGVGLTYLTPVLGMLIVGFSIYYLFTNSEKKSFEKAMVLYNIECIKYRRDKENYTITENMSFDEFNKYERKRLIKANLSQTKMPSIEVDYKKGASHNYFKRHLKNRFGDLIIEDVTLPWEQKYLDYTYFDFDEKARTFIPDFAYVHSETRLCIAIEIDEPYTLSDNTPIHLDDSKRNLFFNKYNWIVIRFAEEQVILNPNDCCSLIQNVVDLILNEATFKDVADCESLVPKIMKWTNETIGYLIQKNHRLILLDKMKDKEIEERIAVEQFLSTLNSMFKK